MSKSYKIGILIFILLLALLSYLEASQPEPVDWSPSYAAADKIPLGTYVLFENLKDRFDVRSVDQPPFEFLSDSSPGGIYFFVNNHLQFDEKESEKLLAWVEKGNVLFVASDAISKPLLDSLRLNVATLIPNRGISSQPMMNLANKELASETAYLYEQETYHSVFTELDTLNHTVLGLSQIYSGSLVMEDPEVNYLRAGFGKGEIFLHTSPQVFSNFFGLHKNNIEYVEKALAYLPSGKTLYWDSYYKAGKTIQTSPLYILFSERSLKWAYHFLIIGALLFVIFEGKRKQRSIPVRKALKNQTYHFTRTVSGMYLDRKDYKSIASKKITLFLEYVRTHLRTPTSSIDQNFFRKLAVHTSIPIEEIQRLFHLIQDIENKNILTKEELLELNEAIEAFKTKQNG